MALGEIRKHYRMEALTTAAALIEQHGGTEAMIDLPEDEAEIFDQECRKLAERLNNMADKLGYKGHSQEPVRVNNIRESLSQEIGAMALSEKRREIRIISLTTAAS